MIIGAALVLTWSDSSRAGNGSAADPDDSTSLFDIKEITWSNDADTVTYTVETYDDWQPDTNDFEVNFALEWDGSANPEACPSVRRDAESANGMTMQVYTSCGHFTTGTPSAGPGTAVKEGRKLTMTFDRALLADTDPSAAPTDYTFTVLAGRGAATDQVPNEGPPLSHDLVAANSTTTSTSTTTSSTSTTSTTAAPTTTTSTSTTSTSYLYYGGAHHDHYNWAAGRDHDQHDAADCPNPSPATVTPSSALPGQEVEVRGGGPGCFRPSSTLTVVYTSEPVVLGTTMTDAFGRYAVIVRIPAGSTPGLHRFTISGAAATSGHPPERRWRGDHRHAAAHG